MASLGGRLADLAFGAVSTPVQVSAVQWMSEQFVRVGVTSPAFTTATWTPGARMRLRTGTLQLRTYTPLVRAAASDTIELIAYTHGDGPGADWFQRVEPGATAEMVGPQRSLDLRDTAGHVVFVGDESSVALAAGRRSGRGRCTSGSVPSTTRCPGWGTPAGTTSSRLRRSVPGSAWPGLPTISGSP